MSSLFSSYHVCSGMDNVRIADGSYSPIVGKGDIVAIPSLHLSLVFHVPNFSLNLLYINHIIKSLNCSVTFLSSYCVFQDLEMKRTIGQGFEKNGLYLLDTSLIIASPVQQVTMAPRSLNKSEDLLQ